MSMKDKSIKIVDWAGKDLFIGEYDDKEISKKEALAKFDAAYSYNLMEEYLGGAESLSHTNETMPIISEKFPDNKREQ